MKVSRRRRRRGREKTGNAGASNKLRWPGHNPSSLQPISCQLHPVNNTAIYPEFFSTLWLSGSIVSPADKRIIQCDDEMIIQSQISDISRSLVWNLVTNSNQPSVAWQGVSSDTVICIPGKISFSYQSRLGKIIPINKRSEGNLWCPTLPSARGPAGRNNFLN